MVEPQTSPRPLAEPTGAGAYVHAPNHSNFIILTKFRFVRLHRIQYHTAKGQLFRYCGV